MKHAYIILGVMVVLFLCFLATVLTLDTTAVREYRIGYMEGMEDADNYIYESNINRLKDYGYITIDYPYQNKTIQLKLYPRTTEESK